MLSLTISNNFHSFLVRWDLLGVRRFFLVIYYNNWDSCSGSINTAISNRVGDFFMFLGVSYFIAVRLRFLGYFFCFRYIIFLIFASFTKSAQFPFMG